MYSSCFVDCVPIVDSIPAPYICENFKSILEPTCKVKMDGIVRRELADECISRVAFTPHCIHALGAVPKPDGNIRPITDCSRPVDRSVNFHCDSLVTEFHYMSVEDVVDILLPGDYMAVIDIKAAYRAVMIDPSHPKYAGFRWTLDGETSNYVDNRLCFGLCSGPAYFNEISCFLAAVLRNRCQIQIVPYLDDFICLGRSLEDCLAAQSCILSLLRYVGFYVSWMKLKPPAQCTT